MSFPFLSAQWRKLIMAQYEVAPEILQRRLPQGLELDLYHGRCFVSLVGFLFDRVRLLGVPVPFHTRFEEVNLRYYVRRPMPDGSFRRGVVFLSEIVPKPAITLVARTLYGEAYSTAPTCHAWGLVGSDPLRKAPRAARHRTRKHFREMAQQQPTAKEAVPWQASRCEVEYEWKHRGLWQRVGVRAENSLQPIPQGSIEEFITEHYWGYAPRRGGGTTEYAVEHRRWEVYPVQEHRVACDFGSLYGAEFADLAGRVPDNVLLAEGAPVVIRWGGSIA
ncbi:MAG TPA: DUF2071 domain-containing protein [Acidobacteriaceae bacterium]|nr:DUF2071 domain-containing protein [Acidobacteriaceae bacterium]